MEFVQSSLEQMQKAFLERLDTIQNQLPSTSLASPGSLAAELATFKNFALTTFRALQAQITLLSQQIDASEMRARRKILLLHGVPEEAEEDTGHLFAKTVAEHLDLTTFSKADISRCHRMGRAAANKPRPILCKMRDVTLRDQIWLSKTGFKGSGITVSEFLTKARHDVFLAARQRFGITKCWTREGNIYVVDPDGVRRRIISMSDLEALPQPKTTSVSKQQAGPARAATPVAAGDVKKRKAVAPRKK